MGERDGRSAAFEALEESLCTDPAVEFAVAFGSHVTGDSHSSSDLDIAVKFADELSAREQFEKRCFLSGELQREGEPFVDLSDIEALPLAVAHDAVNGEFVCGNEQAFRRFEAEIEAAFAERNDEARRRRRAVIDRIAEGGLRG